MRFITWFAAFFEDQEGGGSSKRIALYVVLFYLYLLVKGSLQAKPIDETVLYSIVAIILFLVGGITTEYVGKWFTTNKKD